MRVVKKQFDQMAIPETHAQTEESCAEQPLSEDCGDEQMQEAERMTAQEIEGMEAHELSGTPEANA